MIGRYLMNRYIGWHTSDVTRLKCSFHDVYVYTIKSIDNSNISTHDNIYIIKTYYSYDMFTLINNYHQSFNKA